VESKKTSGKRIRRTTRKVQAPQCLKLRTGPAHRMRLLLLYNFSVRNGWANGTRVRLKMRGSWTAPHKRISKHVQKGKSTTKVIPDGACNKVTHKSLAGGVEAVNASKNVDIGVACSRPEKSAVKGTADPMETWSAAQVHLKDDMCKDFSVYIVKDEEATLTKEARFEETDVQCIPAASVQWVRQVQLMPAYALTGHKAQGLTMYLSYIALRGVFGFGLPYTMFTRTPFRYNIWCIGVPPRDIFDMLLKYTDGKCEIDRLREKLETLCQDEQKLDQEVEDRIAAGELDMDELARAYLYKEWKYKTAPEDIQRGETTAKAQQTWQPKDMLRAEACVRRMLRDNLREGFVKWSQRLQVKSGIQAMVQNEPAFKINREALWNGKWSQSLEVKENYRNSYWPTLPQVFQGRGEDGVRLRRRILYYYTVVKEWLEAEEVDVLRRATIDEPCFSPREFTNAAAKRCGRLTEFNKHTGERYRPEFPPPPADFDWGDGYAETTKRKPMEVPKNNPAESKSTMPPEESTTPAAADVRTGAVACEIQTSRKRKNRRLEDVATTDKDGNVTIRREKRSGRIPKGLRMHANAKQQQTSVQKAFSKSTTGSLGRKLREFARKAQARWRRKEDATRVEEELASLASEKPTLPTASASPTSSAPQQTNASRTVEEVLAGAPQSTTDKMDQASLSSRAPSPMTAVDPKASSSMTAWPYRKGLGIQKISVGLQRFLKSLLQQTPAQAERTGALEAGSGGDCLFHSIAAGLQGMLEGDQDSQLQVLQSFTVGDFHKGKQHLVAKLRGFVANGVAEMPPEEFLNLLVTAVQCQQGSVGHLASDQVWPDRWDPSTVLRRSGFRELINATSVAAVGPNEDGRPEDIIITYSTTHTLERLPLPNGTNLLRGLREHVRDIYRTPGNTHWGTITDAAMLSAAMGIGLIIFSDEVQGTNQWIYNITQSRADYPYWMSLYCEQVTHFQLLTIAVPPDTSPRTTFAASDLPAALVEHYNQGNVATPIGHAVASGIS
jgi:hypothetical protein